MRMAQRDATWSIAAFRTDEYSEGYRRLSAWAKRLSDVASREEVRLASIALMWLLTSPNRFLRDDASKTLVTLLCSDLKVAAYLVAAARQIDDPYVQERVLTCTYGAVLVSGDEDRHGAHAVLESLLPATSTLVEEHFRRLLLARARARVEAELDQAGEQ
jgi:hypothetical protein